MNDSNFINIEDDNNNVIFEDKSQSQLETIKEDEMINKLPDWSIEPPVEINRGNNEL